MSFSCLHILKWGHVGQKQWHFQLFPCNIFLNQNTNLSISPPMIIIFSDCSFIGYSLKLLLSHRLHTSFVQAKVYKILIICIKKSITHSFLAIGYALGFHFTGSMDLALASLAFISAFISAFFSAICFFTDTLFLGFSSATNLGDCSATKLNSSGFVLRILVCSPVPPATMM